MSKDTVARFDSLGQLQKAERTPQGYLRAPAFATKTGVFTYRRADGSMQRELRHPDDVFAPESLATLAGVPVTIEHPKVPGGLLDASNTRDYMVGYAGDQPARDGAYLATTVTVMDAAAVTAAESGAKSELSCGYTCNLVPETGVYDGQPYELRQRNIRHNHLALTAKGRAGPDIRLRLDSADAVQVEGSPTPLEETMEKIILNGVEVQVSPEIKAAILAETAKVRTDSADAARREMQTKLDEQVKTTEKVQARADSLQADLEKAKAEIVTVKADSADAGKIREAVKARLALETVARRVLPADTVAKLDSMDDKAVKVAVIAAESKGASLEGKSEAYIDARFDHIAESIGGEKRDGNKLGEEVTKTRQDSATSDPEKARLASMERDRNRWQSTDGGMSKSK